MDVDLSSDFLSVYNLGSAVLKTVSGDDLELQNCVLKTPQTWKELDPSFGIVIRKGMLFAWPIGESEQPRLRSGVVDEEDVLWTVVGVERRPFVETYAVKCLSLSVEYGLDNYATVLRADEYTKNESGEAIPVWSVLASDIPARWQPIRETSEILEDADWTKTTYRVTFGLPPLDDPADLAGGEFRVVDQDGNRYRITSYECEERVDRLPYATAIRVMEGSEYYLTHSAE